MTTTAERWFEKPSWPWILGIVLTSAVCIADVLGRLQYGPAQLAFFADDFFYYAQIAKNIAFHGTSTFDGTTITNGYHPLWLTVMILFWRVGGNRYFLVLVTCTLVAASFAVYALSFSICRMFRIHGFVALVIALWTLGAFLIVAGGGMEGILAVPLALATIRYLLSPHFTWNTKQSIFYGLLIALTMLARLDTGLLVAPLLVLQLLLIGGPVRGWGRRFAYMALGAWPLWLYFIVNQILFGQMSPISGTAKSLKVGIHFSPVGLLWTYGAIARWTYPRSQILLVAVLLILSGVAATFSGRVRMLPKPQLAILYAGLLFPFLHIAMLAIVGDWQLFFIWYYYTFVIADLCAVVLCLIAIHLPALPRLHPLIEVCSLAVILISILFSRALTLRPGPRNYTYTAAVHIADFARTHPGRYAMGDRGAIVGYLLAGLGDPMVQTEGIVMDRKFISKIRAGADLVSTLREYQVDYYIATNPVVEGNCYHVEEPSYAGPLSPKMRSVICDKPIHLFTDPPNTVFAISPPRREISRVGADR